MLVGADGARLAVQVLPHRALHRSLILERGRLVYDGSLFRALQLYKGQLN